ncbi:MAG: hypothetical protein DRR19_14530 [Candidatus Parabeggiatoa sp. nov. 1]|nr:MAG: hypothetical protein DRR19_14530 [Gammaproteobacteria bacterium]
MESAALLTKNDDDSLRASMIEIRLSRDEVLLLNKSLNEVCYGFGLGSKEFERRIGTKRENVIELLKKIGSKINQFARVPQKTVEDETDYLLKSPANALQLERARQEFEAGQGIIVDNLDDLDKLLE